jgi:hypothetical protein
MTIHLGYVAAGSTIYIPFATFSSTGASVTITGLATSDILIYKNGSTTERSSVAGFTLLDTDGIDFDGKTGLHGISIDLNDNTDAGFYAAGSFYMVGIASITVDGQTVNFWAATFFIGPAQANVTQWKGTDAATVDTNGYPVVTVKDGTGQGEVLTTSGAVDLVTTATNLTNAGGLTQADVRTAVGLASANLDTQLTAIDDLLDAEIPALTAAVAALPTSILDLAAGVETGVTPRQALRLILAALAGKLSGAATTTVVVRNVGDTKARITATVDADGNRTAMALDAT